MVPEKVHGWNITAQKPSTHHSSAPAAQYGSCLPPMTTLHFPWGNEKYSEENKAALLAEGRAEKLLWARPGLSEWEESKTGAPLLPGHSLLGRLSPTRKWINGRKIEVLITTSEARGDKISLLLQLSSCHFPFYVFLTLRALFFFFVMYRVCDYPLLKG